MNVQGLTRPGPSRFFYQFLLGNERATAKEIRDEYVETLSKIYLSYFRSYLGRLMKVQVSWAVRGSLGEDGAPSCWCWGPRLSSLLFPLVRGGC